MNDTRSEEKVPAFGRGVYSFPFAARILSSRPNNRGSVSSRALRYWMQVGLTDATWGRGIHGSAILSFHDLISLEIVRLLRDEGASLQKVRALEVVLREKYPDFTRPFAHNVFYTDGVSVWEQLSPGGHLEEIVGRRRGNLAWTGPVAVFATEIDYRNEIASAWHLNPWVEIDPEVHFGVPVVRGTSVPVSAIAANLEADSAEVVADAYGLEMDQVRGVKEYLNAA